MQREPGFYWVKNRTFGWQVLELDDLGQWFAFGVEMPVTEPANIGPRIIPPEEKE